MSAAGGDGPAPPDGSPAPAPGPSTPDGPVTLSGIAVSSGYAIGVVHLVDRRRLKVPRAHIEPEAIEAELERFERAIAASEAQIAEVRANLNQAGEEHTLILDAHQMMLRDDMLVDGVRQAVRGQRINAEWALRKVVRGLKHIFDNIDDEYFRERRSDVDFVGDRIMRNLLGSRETHLEAIPPGAVVVAHDLSPADTVQLDQANVLGFATDVGGKTSHTAILARSLQLPAVVALERVSEVVGSGDVIIVDGMTGKVHVHPSPSQIEAYRARAAAFADTTADLQRQAHSPCTTTDGHTLRVRGNIEGPAETASVAEAGGDGVGLFRTEYLFMNRPTLPDEATQYAVYRQVLEAAGAAGATIRTLDVGGDKLIEPLRRHRELNPIMGLRAIRFCLHQIDIFRAQLRALLRASAHGTLRLLVPLVSGLEEIEAVRGLLDEISAELAIEGHAVGDYALGIMIELPSAAALADVLAPAVDFFAIGTNDLIQYTLAIDRANEQVAHLYQPLHPAVLRQLEFVIRAAQGAGIGVSMCGEMAGDPFYVPVLLGLGLSDLSCTPPGIAVVKTVARHLAVADCRALYAELRGLRRAVDVRRHVADWVEARLGAALPPDLLDLFDLAQRRAPDPVTGRR